MVRPMVTMTDNPSPIDVQSLVVLAAPFLGTTGIQHIVAAFKGTIPSQYLPLLSLVCGLVFGLLCAVAFGYVNREGLAVFSMAGILAGANASAGASAIKTADHAARIEEESLADQTTKVLVHTRD